jgi:hypothetical protein
MYIRPIVENIFTPALSVMRFSPYGPTITPAIMSPIILGTLIRLRSIGDTSTINRSRAKISTGFVNGIAK